MRELAWTEGVVAVLAFAVWRQVNHGDDLADGRDLAYRLSGTLLVTAVVVAIAAMVCARAVAADNGGAAARRIPWVPLGAQVVVVAAAAVV